MSFKQNEEAVSPVIGVILMVAITVILAAVIAAFVFGMIGGVTTTKSVAATVSQQNNTSIVVTYQGGQDHSSLMWLNVTSPNGTRFWTSEVSSKFVFTNESAHAPVAPSVGSSMILRSGSDDWSGRDHVVVTARFGDGTDQVILDTYV